MNKPNVIIMLMDNLGYGDLGCYGSRKHRTPNVDALAREGMRFTGFYSTSGVCTPSRASLMTGCYPRRVNLQCSGQNLAVLMPVDQKGLHPDEVTLARLLKDNGYRTACIGKWHLGDQPPFLPTRHGFDEYFGIPYSEDMVPDESHPHWPPLPLMRNERVIEAPPDRDLLTRRYTEESIRFIRSNRDKRFFLYLAHAMPGSSEHSFASGAFRGKSANGLYGDAVEELDWSAGAIMRTLKELQLDDRTLVIWTSDNGAVRHTPEQGSNAPLKGWGYETSEGAQRVPCIMRFPGQIPAGVVRDELTTMMDILPTVARLVGVQPPGNRAIDGHDISAILFNEPNARSPYDAIGFFYYHLHQLQAVRAGAWKLYLPLERKFLSHRGNCTEGEKTKARLYDVRNDLGETRELAADHPEIVEKLSALAERARQDLGDWDHEGANQRRAGWVADPKGLERNLKVATKMHNKHKKEMAVFRVGAGRHRKHQWV
ncbi:MAG: sulfatase [Lentisphaerae bacterium]|nr:sulfatase [Lentisphaerota bacterium]